MVLEFIDAVNASHLFSDFVSAIVISVGTIFLVGMLKVFCGRRLKPYIVMVGMGLMLFAILHEFPEFLFGAGIHGGFPETLYGKLHIILFGSMGSVIFFIGCFMLYRAYSEYLEAD